MATSRKTYLNISPKGLGEHKVADEHIPTEDLIGAYLATNFVGKLFNKNAFPLIGGNMPYTAAQWTVTSTGTGAAQAQATTPGGGILLTTGSTSTFYSGLQSKATVTPTTGKVYCAYTRLQLSNVTQVGFNFGFANAQADPTGTEYTDFIGFRKAPGTAAIKGTVAGNGAAVVQTATLITPVAATEYYLGFWLYLTASTTTCYGSFVYGTGPNSLTELGMSSTIITEAVKFLTTPPTDWGLTCFATGTNGNNPTCTFTSVMAAGDN